MDAHFTRQSRSSVSLRLINNNSSLSVDKNNDSDEHCTALVKEKSPIRLAMEQNWTLSTIVGDGDCGGKALALRSSKVTR